MNESVPIYENTLVQLGFKFDVGSTHTKRTMMLTELQLLLDAAGDNENQAGFFRLIVDENCLHKQTLNNRKYSASYLKELYGLNPSILLFRALRFFWTRDTDAIPLLAILCVYARDELVRKSAPYILGVDDGTSPKKDQLEGIFEREYPGRFSEIMLQSLVRNLLSTWTQSGHLTGKVKKVRTRPQVTAGAIAYALLLAYLTGGRGMNLFSSEYVKLLDCGRDRALELAEEASRRGWIVFKSIGDVIEVQFPKLLTAEEKELVREQA